MARTLGDILEMKGYAPKLAVSGAEALVVMRDHPVDILLTDICMPDMNGVALFRLARKDHPKLITMLMTAYAADDIIQQGFIEGIKIVLSKPLDIDFLLTLFSSISRLEDPGDFSITQSCLGGFNPTR